VEAADRLGLIVRAGAGTDNIDRAAASAAGIYVCNVPGRAAIAVAELTIGLLLAVDRRIADAAADLRVGRWDKAGYATADGIYGKRLAIIGLGDIGLAVAERAKALGMTINALRKDQRSPAAQAQIRSIGIRLVDSREELLGNADVVSLHVPHSPGTVGLVDTAFLDLLPDGAIVLNTSGGEVVDEAALLAAIEKRGMRAGLDVYCDEPPTPQAEWTSPLASHPRVVGTHHIGASTRQAQEAVANGVVEVLHSYEHGEPVNCVNLLNRRGETTRLIVRHRDHVGVLAEVLNLLRERGLDVRQMSNQVFEGSEAAVATIVVDGTVDASVTAALDQIDEVLASTCGP
jgi:D-3-phosphoglycerate dehydrogenase / 2-oxoglutarate reductase